VFPGGLRVEEINKWLTCLSLQEVPAVNSRVWLGHFHRNEISGGELGSLKLNNKCSVSNYPSLNDLCRNMSPVPIASLGEIMDCNFHFFQSVKDDDLFRDTIDNRTTPRSVRNQLGVEGIGVMFLPLTKANLRSLHKVSPFYAESIPPILDNAPDTTEKSKKNYITE
jgi:hypothetical protein